MENAAAILSVPGIDLGWLGHYDLSDSLGCVGVFDDPRYVAAEAAICAAATQMGKPIGWLAGNAALARDAVAKGYRCLCLNTDIGLLRDAFTTTLATARAG